jgi:hypothetical protein
MGSTSLAGDPLRRFFLLNEPVLTVSHLFVSLCAFQSKRTAVTEKEPTLRRVLRGAGNLQALSRKGTLSRD